MTPGPWTGALAALAEGDRRGTGASGRGLALVRPWLPAAAVLCASAVASLGGPSLYPLVLVAAALASRSATASGAAALVATGALVDAAVGAFGGGPWSWWGRVTLLALAAAAPHALRALQGRLAERADGVLGRPRPRARELEPRGSARRLEGGAEAAVEVAQLALACRTVAAYVLDEDGGHLTLAACRSSSGRIREGPFSAGEGVLGAVVKQGRAVRMHAEQEVRGVTHYEPEALARGALPVRALVAVPLGEPGAPVRGVLVADAADAVAFSDSDERLLAVVGRELLRAVDLERCLAVARRATEAQVCFFDAVGALNRAGTRDEVAAAVLAGARGVAPLDACALTLVRDDAGADGLCERRTHQVVCAWDADSSAEPLGGREFADNAGLVANVARYGAALPERCAAATEAFVVFDAPDEPAGLRSLRVFPLSSGARVLGTLIAGSRTRDDFEPAHLRMLESLAIQAAQALHRAQLFDQMEKFATTDGLTGLVNRRTFEDRFEVALAAARRYGRAVALLVADVDHFKRVNDVYGHPVGDLVLRAVGRTLREAARDTDVVARCGGEEFALLMPETELEGALVIAERIRERIERTLVATPGGPLSVTISLGVAAARGGGVAKAELYAHADRCLYAAKREGRNRVVSRPAPEPRQRPRRLEAAARSAELGAPSPAVAD